MNPEHHVAISLNAFEELFTATYEAYDANDNRCLLRPQVWAEHRTMMFYGLRFGDVIIWTGHVKVTPGLIGEFPQLSTYIMPPYGAKIETPPISIQQQIEKFTG